MEYKLYTSIDQTDANVAYQQVSTGLLSGFVGAKGKEFYGGQEVLSFEADAVEMLGYEHAVSVNSWTSGLLLMLHALNVDEQDAEVIVTPWTMSATVFTIIQAGMIPVFADIDESTFMPTEESIRKKVTKKTAAIMLADIFGQSFAYETLTKYKSKGIKILSDAAQAHLAVRNGKPVGWEADCTGISLNRHKHINTGEGGLILTNNPTIAEHCKLARNHGENLNFEETKIPNMIGYNFRLTETQAAIGRNQLTKLPALVESRQFLANIANTRLESSKYFKTVPPMPGNSHSYYIYPMLLTEEYQDSKFRARIASELSSRGMPSPLTGYQNVHRLDLFQNDSASSGRYKKFCTKPKCEIAEHLHDTAFMGILFCNTQFSEESLLNYLDVMEVAASRA